MATKMRSGPGALLVAYGLTGLSLWTMNGDIVALYSDEVGAGAVGSAIEEEHVRMASLEKHLSAVTRRPIRIEKPFRQFHRLAEFLQWEADNNGPTGMSTSGPRLAAGKLEGMKELRRRAAMALMVVAFVESSGRGGG
ncbi:MAG: hypothetical protein ACREQ7_04695 [Candidatus Binatia bacterium]